MHFSFSTVLMALLASIITAVLLAIPFLRKNFTPSVGYKSLFCFVVLALLRLLLPFEFPFTSNILLPQFLSKITVFLRHPRIHVMGMGISLWTVFEIIWIVGIVISLLLSIRSHRRARNYILKRGVDKTEEPKYKEILEDICRRNHRNNRFRVMELPDLDVPIIWGVWQPCIILPAGLDIPPDKLEYILYHETLHYFRHDPIVKKAIHLLAIIYWWNPACRLLHKHSNLLLEMYVDQAITRGNPDVIQAYTECLLFIKKQAVSITSKAAKSLGENACPLIRLHDDDIERRVIMLMKKPAAFQKVGVNILLGALILIVLACSHLYIFEASCFSPPAEGEIAFHPTAENTYFIMDELANYEVYINDVYIETVTDLEFYPKGIRIYNKKGEQIGET